VRTLRLAQSRILRQRIAATELLEVPEINRRIQRWFNLRSIGALALDKRVVPVLPLNDIEQVMIPYAAQGNGGPAAAFPTIIELGNPASTNVLLRVWGIIVENPAGVAINIFLNSSLGAVTGVSGAFKSMDQRITTLSGAFLTVLTTVAQFGTTVGIFQLQNGVSFDISTLVRGSRRELAILPPGTGVSISSGAVNQALGASFAWTEEPATP
jgi:hypothetical protein